MNCFNFDGAGVDLAVVKSLVFVLYVPDVQVPVLAERPLHRQPFIVDDASVFKSQKR